MLKSTFRHLKGVGEKSEQGLWRRGILTWEEYRCYVENQLSIFSYDEPNDVLRDSFRAYESGDVAFFSKHLPTGEYYRVALSYPDETVFLDIETTGLSLYYDKITLVGWSMGQEYGVYIAGKDEAPLRAALKRAKVIVTFNGIMFDLKFLHKTFENLYIPATHLDLRFFARRVGLAGGQKKIEQKVGFKRTKRLVELHGGNAPVLWHKYRRGDNKALIKLIEYNHADVEGMPVMPSSA